MAFTEEVLIEKILKPRGLWPPKSTQDEDLDNTVSFDENTIEVNGQYIGASDVGVADADTFYIDGTGYRFWGIDSNETSHAGSKAESYANWQKSVTLAAIEYAQAEQLPISINTIASDVYGRDVADIKVAGQSLSELYAVSGITPVTNGGAKEAVPNDAPTKNHLINKSNKAMKDGKGIWGLDQKYEVHPDRKFKREDIKYLGNDRYGQDKKMGKDVVKLGDVYLDIPPTHITVTQLRTSYSVPQLGNKSKPTTSNTARTVIKLNVIFSGEQSINTDLIRIIHQFKYCPINLLYSQDIFEKVVGDNQYIRESYSADMKEWFVPVTMDEYTIYSIEGHPGSLGCTIQLSIFNYAAFFSGDINERVQYNKFELNESVVNTKQGLAVANRDFVYTPHLEEAIHPYNLYIMDHLNHETRRFSSTNSNTEIFKVSGTKIGNKKDNLDRDVLYKEVEDDKLRVILDSGVVELTAGTSIFFQNNFAWMPIIGYSQPVAQYIGPGECVVSINLKTNNNDVITRLLSTFGDSSMTDMIVTYYDDRYILLNSLTKLCGVEVCSLKNFATSNIDSHPEYMDINMVFNASEYEIDTKNSNPVAEFDEYFGLQRILKASGKDLDKAVKVELVRAKLNDVSINPDTDIFSKLAQRSGITRPSLFVNNKTIAAYNKVLDAVNRHKNEFSVTDSFGSAIGISPDSSAQAYALSSNGAGSEIFKINGSSIIDRLNIKALPKSKATTFLNSRASEAFELYYSTITSEVNKTDIGGYIKSFEHSVKNDSDASYYLRAKLIETYASGWAITDINGDRTYLDTVNTALYKEKSNPTPNGIYYAEYEHGTTSIQRYWKWRDLVADEILKAIERAGLMKAFNDRWNEHSLLEARGNSVNFEFVGTPIEAKVLQYAFLLGNTDEDMKNQKAKAVQYWSDEARTWPSFIVGYSVKDSDMAVERIKIPYNDRNKQARWVFQITYLPSKDLSDIDDMTGIDPLNQSDINKMLRTGDDGDGPADYCIPWAAHRYYPNIDQFIRHQELFSTSVGEWYANSQADDPSRTFSLISETVEKAISPLLNRPGWTSVYMQKNKGQKFIDKINEDPNDPSKTMEGLNYPAFVKDLSDIEKDGYTLRRLGPDGIDTTVSKITYDMNLDENQEPKEGNVAVGTVQQMAAFSSGYYDYAKIMGDEIINFRANVSNWLEMPINSTRKTAMHYNYQNRLQGKAVGGVINQSSAIMEASLAGALDSDARKVDSDINMEKQYGGAYEANCLLTTLQKSPEMFMRQVGREAPAVKALTSDSGLNEVETHNNFKKLILKVLLEDSVNSKTYIRPMPLMDMEAEEHAVTLKEKIKPSVNAYYMDATDIKSYLEEGITAELTNKLKVRVANKLPTSMEKVDDGTKELVGRSMAASMLPTAGIENAFPTYKMYVIEEDLSDIRYFSLDDYYDIRTAQDLMIVKSKDNPAHTLKARLVVDHRFITVTDNVKQRLSDRNEPQDFEVGIPSRQIIDTREENHFNKGMAPLREGMRICIKLGYHSDPRALDTVFIGTITGMHGNMSTGVYDLEARGDGRELLTPPSQVLKPNITGKNFAEIISVMLRTNPSIIHFGKVYGSFLEKLSRRHFALFALARNGYLTKAIGVGALGVSSSFLGLSRFTAKNAAKKIAISMAAGGLTAGAYMIGAYTDKVGKLYNQSSLPFSDRNKYEDLATYSDKLFGGLWLQKEYRDYKFSQVKGWIAGNTFDPRKASRQMAGIMYNTFKQGNNPIDDNIWAIDVWQTLALWRNFDMPVNNTRTVWDILVDIKRVYPNFALDVRPYGSRSTLFMGPKEFNIWRTDDPLQAMAPQLTEISNNSIWSDKYKYNSSAKEDIQALVTKNRYGDSTPSSNNIAPWVPFQRTHMVTSFGEIVMNGIRSTPSRGWNNVVVSYSKDAGQNNSNPVVMQSANVNLNAKSVRTKYASIDWTNDENMAKHYAKGLLKEGVEKMYGGSIIVRGNSKIEPYDKVFICDSVNKMYGWIEAETVIHKFDTQMGFTTHIVPNMVCSINNDSYSTFGQIFRRQMNDKWGKLITSSLAGFAAGGAVTAIAGPWAIVIGATLSVLAVGYSAKNSYSKIKSQAESIMTKAEAEGMVRREEELLTDNLNWIFFNNQIKSSYDLGVMADYLRRMSGKNGLGLKVSGALHPIRTSKEATNKVYLKAKERYSIAKGFINEYRTGSSLNKAAKLHAKLDSVAKSLGHNIDWNKIEAQKSNAKAASELRKQLSKVLSSAGNDFAPESRKIIEDALGKDASKQIAKERTAMKSTPKVSARDAVKNATKKLPGIKSIGGFMFAWLAIGIESLPAVFETFVANAMLNANTIMCEPLWSKYSMMMTGMEGYQNKTAYMHIEDMIVQAHSYVDKAIDAVSEWDHMIQIGAEISPLAESARNAISNSGGSLNE